MARADDCVARQGEQAVVHVLVQQPSIPLLKVCPATAPYKKGITSECESGRLSPKDIGNTAIGMPRSGSNLKHQVADPDRVGMFDMNVCLRTRAF
mmetsp:Transcript_1547/g.3642  ORF Transcript_1547/g.3642 Transcript_1547/m.3642 type:complete len:95 (+) Transcript_1547:415-699(+)